MAAKQPTKYEIAQVRLRAFEILAGWGVQIPATDDKKPPELRLWNFDERMKFAAQLASWALKS